MRDKQRFINGSSTIHSRRKTIRFEMQQLAHESADDQAAQQEYEREIEAAQAAFDEVVLIVRTNHMENRLRQHAEAPLLVAAE